MGGVLLYARGVKNPMRHNGHTERRRSRSRVYLITNLFHTSSLFTITYYFEIRSTRYRLD